MNTVKIAPQLEISRIVLGIWRLLDWNMTDQQLLTYLKQSIEAGVTTFDHADIYGDYECEAGFGKALQLEPSLRSQMQLITKCGIKLKSSKFPDRSVKYYDYSKKYIIQQVEQSLKNLNTDYIDVLLLHRPSPIFNPNEVAAAFDELKTSGKLNHLGVSNFTPVQFESLQSYIKEPLVTNQIEISPGQLEHFENGNLDYLIEKRVSPMAWSPLGGGSLLNPQDEKSLKTHDAIARVAVQIEETDLSKVIYAWTLMHPSHIIPVLGTGKIERLKTAVDALDTTLSLEQWFDIYTASLGTEVA
ncbi:aldo/keto reductase [Nonlabens ulvanivorans]|uniref:aldo/keto reductase n=1 Tax=Nonlabens ulvanivorans TaxID=906888 RepID=UPI002942E3BB|nr:aldo/keto reductase [Nonlabens ulvanivorans]WOI23588.1 aldo/keto reductase [Nonlabens ulvanivorans]